MSPENSQEEYPNPQDLPPEDAGPVSENADETPVNFDDDGEDPLKRHTKFSWKSFGGDGFIVSVIFHAVLIIFALFYVVATIQPKEPEPAEFVSGAGGGADGDNANRQQRRMRQKPRDMSTQNKITSKSTHSTLTLPEMPKMSTNVGAMGSMKAGGASSGHGGGAGGGIGSGIGPGIGNGRAFLSAFGSSFSGAVGLKGTLYDLKRSKDGRTTFATTNQGDAGKRKNELHAAIKSLVASNFSASSSLGRKYYAAPTKLNANQVYIYKEANGQPILATAATNAFKGPDGKIPFNAPGWMVVYEGEITPPETGEYRFVGMGDDAIIVGLDRKPVFYAYWPGEGHGPAVKEPPNANWEPKNHCATDGKGSGSGGGLLDHVFKGSWMKLNKGRKYKICIAFGEGAGGKAGAALAIEKKGENNGGRYSVFKLGAIDPDLMKILFIEGRYKADGPNFMVRKSR